MPEIRQQLLVDLRHPEEVLGLTGERPPVTIAP